MVRETFFYIVGVERKSSQRRFSQQQPSEMPQAMRTYDVRVSYLILQRVFLVFLRTTVCVLDDICCYFYHYFEATSNVILHCSLGDSVTTKIAACCQSSLRREHVVLCSNGFSF